MNSTEKARVLAEKITLAANTPILSLAGFRLPPAILLTRKEIAPATPRQILYALHEVNDSWEMNKQGKNIRFSCTMR